MSPLVILSLTNTVFAHAQAVNFKCAKIFSRVLLFSFFKYDINDKFNEISHFDKKADKAFRFVLFIPSVH